MVVKQGSSTLIKNAVETKNEHFELILKQTKFVGILRIFDPKIRDFKIAFDVKQQILAHQVYKKNYAILYWRCLLISNI